jgi:glycosyltransferase involved in cell wall biosynthesis
VRICVLSSVHPPFDARTFQREIKTLIQAGHEVTLICGCPEREQSVDGVRVLGFPPRTALLSRPLNWLNIMTLMRRVPADAYQFIDPELLPLAWLLSRWTHKPVVYDCIEHYGQAILSDERIPAPVRRLSAWFFDSIEKAIAGGLAGVIVVDEWGQKHFDHVRRVIRLRNLPWQEMFGAPTGEDGAAHRLVYLGDISESRRGISLLVEVMALLRHTDVSLLMVGDIDTPQTRARLETLIADRRLGDRVQIIGHVPYEAVTSYLRQATIGLLVLRPTPRWEDVIPIKVFEYMAAGIPFVASDTLLLRQFVAELGTGMVVKPQSAQAFADAIDQLLDHPEQARQMGENGRQAFLREYNWDKESRALIEFYGSLSD